MCNSYKIAFYKCTGVVRFQIKKKIKKSDAD